MQSLWNSEEAPIYQTDPISLRAYATRLLFQSKALATSQSSLTSAKIAKQNIFGEPETRLAINEADHQDTASPTSSFIRFKQDTLLKLAQQPALAVSDLESQLQLALAEITSKTPPLDALVHASLPPLFIDQTCSDSILALVNHANRETLVKEIYGARVPIAPYAPAGRERAQSISNLIQDRDLSEIEGIIIEHVGLLTFHDEAERCYERTIRLTNEADRYFAENCQPDETATTQTETPLIEIADLRKTVSTRNGHATLTHWDASPSALYFSSNCSPNLLGPNYALTDGDHQASLEKAATPQHVGWPGRGIFSFGNNLDESISLGNQAAHTSRAIGLAEATGGWKPLQQEPTATPEPTDSQSPLLQGKIALVSGSAAGIGLATATTLAEAGACVVGADINPEIEAIMADIGALGIPVDLTQESQIEALIERIVREYGGLDIVVSNAGIFTAGAYIEDMDPKNWDRSMQVNLTSHQVLLKHAIPFVKKGIDPTIILMGSRNVNAPGAGAASYSCAKAALTQLCRVAALELAPEGVRVNIIHPDAVFDTKLWTQEALERSAERYGITVEQYKKRNLMKTEITSRSVGNTVVALASDAFAKTTGAQIPVDGGNDRII